MACPTGKLKVESKDPRINYNLLPGEKLMTCPYNRSHALLPIKFAKHVLHCHRLHCKEQKAKNEESLFRICRYDRSHHVRREEIEFHEENCDKKSRDDDWGCGWDDEAEGWAEDKFSTEIKVAPLQKPPPIDEASMKILQESEDWESEKTGWLFNPEKQICKLRQEGYKVVKTQGPIGLTRSEKKQFYEHEKLAMEMHAENNFIDHMKRLNNLTGGTVSMLTTSAAASSCASAYGYDTDEILMSTIREED